LKNALLLLWGGEHSDGQGEKEGEGVGTSSKRNHWVSSSSPKWLQGLLSNRTLLERNQAEIPGSTDKKKDDLPSTEEAIGGFFGGFVGETLKRKDWVGRDAQVGGKGARHSKKRRYRSWGSHERRRPRGILGEVSVEGTCRPEQKNDTETKVTWASLWYGERRR